MRKDEEGRLGMALIRDAGEGAEADVDFDAGEVWDLVSGELSAVRVAELADAAVANPRLAEAWRIAVEIRKERARQSRRVPARGILALAAVILLALLAPLMWRQLHPGPVLRGGAGEAIVPAFRNGIVMPRDHFLLRWSDRSGTALSYDLVVMRPDLKELLVAEKLKEPEFRVDEKVFEGIAEGEEILWQVKSHQRDGGTLLSSTFVVRLGGAEHPE